MKRIAALLLCLILILCGCGSAPKEAPPSTAYTTETAPIYERGLQIGNIIFNIPEAFIYTTSEEGDLAMIMSKDQSFTMSLASSNISSEDETACKGYLIAYEDSIKDEGFSYLDEKPMDAPIGDLDIVLSSYIKADTDLNFSLFIGGAFTDSYYIYRVKIDYDSSVESDVIEHFGELWKSALYLGEEPRYDFIQVSDF